jgi:hypothetical protein
MRTLQQFEVELVSGGTWLSFWNIVTDFFEKVLGSRGGLAADVRLCTSNGGTANFSSQGGSFTASTGVRATVPVEGMLVSMSVSGERTDVRGGYTLTCTGANGGNDGNGCRGGHGGNGKICEP